VTQHRTGNSEWWLYDDYLRLIATEEQLSSLCSYGHWGPMQSYVLIYELCDGLFISDVNQGARAQGAASFRQSRPSKTGPC
jgi:hypothetical protein